jgi:hypothetical protein
MRYLILLLIAIPSVSFSEPYSTLSLQAVNGRHDLLDSESLMLNIGIGYRVSGFFMEWDAGMNAEVPFQDIFTIEENQQKIQMSVVTGYLWKLTSENHVKFSVGSKAATFDENCYEYVEKTYCEQKKEYGPTYKVGYFYRPNSKLILGVEFNSDELSERRKYGGAAFSVNNTF